MKIRNEGFTIIELLAGVLISGILMAGLYAVFYSQQVAFSAQEEMAEMNQNVRAALDLMAREIRLAGYKSSGSTLNGIQSATANSIQVLCDLDQDGNTTGPNENITYSYNAGTMQVFRTQNGGVAVPIADNITGLSFLYTMVNGSQTSSPAVLADIRRINVSLDARTSHPSQGTGAYRTISLTSDVTPRNLGL